MINNKFFQNRRGDIPITILVIGVLMVCSLALFSFFSSTVKIRNSFVGIGLIEAMNSQIEENYFYGRPLGTMNSEFEGNIYVAINYAKQNKIVNRICNCEDNCENYADWIIESSSANGISDPVLLLSLMMQESDCTSNAFSGSSIGLMQINLMHCGNYGLPADKEECKRVLIDNPKLNIEIGAKILKESYNTYKDGKTFQGCSNRNIFYSGWDAAIRGYNGWGCGKDASGNLFYSQDNYVEEVMSRYGELKKVGNYLEKKGKGSIFDLEITNKFPFVKRKDKTLFSVEYKFKP
jgi:hypothetical protein